MSTVWGNVLLVVLWTLVASKAFASAAGVQQNVAVTPANFVQHEIFSNIYHKPFGSEAKSTNKIAKLVVQLRQMSHLGLDERISLKISRVKSGPLDRSVTEILKPGPGVHTQDGYLGEDSKGYGVKFSYNFE